MDETRNRNCAQHSPLMSEKAYESAFALQSNDLTAGHADKLLSEKKYIVDVDFLHVENTTRHT